MWQQQKQQKQQPNDDNNKVLANNFMRLKVVVLCPLLTGPELAGCCFCTLSTSVFISPHLPLSLSLCFVFAPLLPHLAPKVVCLAYSSWL